MIVLNRKSAGNNSITNCCLSATVLENLSISQTLHLHTENNTLWEYDKEWDGQCELWSEVCLVELADLCSICGWSQCVWASLFSVSLGPSPNKWVKYRWQRDTRYYYQLMEWFDPWHLRISLAATASQPQHHQKSHLDTFSGINLNTFSSSKDSVQPQFN